MRIGLLSLLVTLLPFCNFAQRGDMIVKEDNLQFFSVTYGHHLYFSDFGNNFNSLDEYAPFQPVQSVGFMVTTYEPNAGQHRLGNVISYAQILPQSVTINDTLLGKINGFNFGLTLLHMNVTPKSKWSTIGLGVGFNTGRMRMKSGNYRSQKNPYWAPAIFFTPQFIIKKFSVGLNASYQFDVSRRGWRTLNFSNKELDFELNEFRHTGLMANISIGFKM